MKYLSLLCCLLGSCLALPAQQSSLPELPAWIDQDYPYLESLYLHLHTHPELSFYEFETAKRIAEELRSVGYTVSAPFGGSTGLVGVLENGEGPTVLVRADLDALPVAEETGLPYASRVTTTDEAGNTVPVMHACGHDVHMSVLVGTARALAAQRDQWSGRLVLIGQPAEERSGGAKAMLKEGLYEKFPRPDYALALHVNEQLPAGSVGYCSGFAMANVDMVDITVYGRGGHGAAPHLTIDPVVLAARLILDLQTIVSRELDPLAPAVVTVGAIHGGAKGNVIPDQVELQLTLRSYSDELRNGIIEKIERIGNGLAASAGLSEQEYPKVVVRDEYTPALYNDPKLTERIAGVFAGALGKEQVVTVDSRMVGEDFGRFGRTDPRVPIFLYWLGSVDPAKKAEAERNGQTLPALHSSRYAPLPEPTIKTGVLTMSAAVLHLLQNPGK